jgi:hypothetical protein
MKQCLNSIHKKKKNPKKSLFNFLNQQRAESENFLNINLVIFHVNFV